MSKYFVLEKDGNKFGEGFEFFDRTTVVLKNMTVYIYPSYDFVMKEYPESGDIKLTIINVDDVRVESIKQQNISLQKCYSNVTTKNNELYKRIEELTKELKETKSQIKILNLAIKNAASDSD